MKTQEDPFPGLQIRPSKVQDLDVIFRLFAHAIAYQKKNGYELWPQFSEQLIRDEIAGNRHWKIEEGETIVCVFSILYNDVLIWGEERNKEPSVYLHRIAVNPAFKGRAMMHVIKHWALEHAKQNGKKYIRMDTWGNNENLRNYYIRCGFDYLGQQHIPEADNSPGHYGGPVLSLFQVEV